MAKYYISSGSINCLFSTNWDQSLIAAHFLKRAYYEINANPNIPMILDEYIYIDERGFRNWFTSTPDTFVIKTQDVKQRCGL